MNNSINELLIKIFSEAVESYNIIEMKKYLSFDDNSYNEKMNIIYYLTLLVLMMMY